ncbi:MAG TPA: SpoIID/LytB domain-containing protein, partial [Candidatus Bathyarchaeia archaeon]|nr:SpoIID/LytB domain-containing protein [Candidatus Bathyarchaeia archaeon]
MAYNFLNSLYSFCTNMLLCLCNWRAIQILTCGFFLVCTQVQGKKQWDTMCALYKQKIARQKVISSSPHIPLLKSYIHAWRENEKKSASSVVDAIVAVKYQAKQATVRVLLDVDEKREKSWTLFCEHGFIIEKKENKKIQSYTSTQKTVVLSAKKNIITVNGKSAESPLVIIKPRTGYITFNEKAYKGSFIGAVYEDTLYFMNALPLEEYITAVVHSETWPGWPLEVNKVFAIASRSYVLAMMRQAERSGRLYHIKDTNQHQRYNLYGVEHPDSVVKAVQQTEGVFLSYNNEPIVAMFDCCCGGIIPAHIAHVNFQEAPYLARTYACTFCKKCSLYQWKAEYDFASFEHIISREKKLHQRMND